MISPLPEIIPYVILYLMKHCFVVNPAAGSGKDQQVIMPYIMDGVKQRGAIYEIHRTSGPGEATSFVRGRLESEPDETIRFYACGGDGSVAEVLNGLYGFSNAELAIIPLGSGNDYVRNFGERKQFLDVPAQIAGEAVPVDVMRFSYIPHNDNDTDDAGIISSYALNMINIGFDARVASRMAQMKRLFFLKGTGAYVAGIVWELAGYGMGRAVFRIEGMDDLETDILLAGVGSGQYSGGGFKGVPGAVVNDGELDFMVIEPIKRSEFIRLVGAYHDGKHPENERLKGKLHMARAKEVIIEPAAPLVFTADGEPLCTNKPLTVSVAEEKVRFVIPDGIKKP